ncbi:arginine decarboxylase, partial [Pseudomonas aeruginosa]
RADSPPGVPAAIRYAGERRALGRPVDPIDGGGGLGVDDDGTQSRNASSMNYALDDYDAGVCGRLTASCDAQGRPHPHICSESGRAL